MGQARQSQPVRGEASGPVQADRNNIIQYDHNNRLHTFGTLDLFPNFEMDIYVLLI